MQEHHIDFLRGELWPPGCSDREAAERVVNIFAKYSPQYRLRIESNRRTSLNAHGVAFRAIRTRSYEEVQDGTPDIICNSCDNDKCFIWERIVAVRRETPFQDWERLGVKPIDAE